MKIEIVRKDGGVIRVEGTQEECMAAIPPEGKEFQPYPYQPYQGYPFYWFGQFNAAAPQPTYSWEISHTFDQNYMLRHTSGVHTS